MSKKELKLAKPPVKTGGFFVVYFSINQFSLSISTKEKSH